MQRDLSAADLAIVLALVRAGTLAEAGAQESIDASTVFRTVQRLEKSLGQRLFERSRSGYRPTELTLQLCRHAEAIETALMAARSACAAPEDPLSGTVRLSAVDAVLNSLVIPALGPLLAAHPQLRLELHGANELSSLTHRDVDIALRSTNRPPEHLVGKRLGTMRFAIYGGPAAGYATPSADWSAEQWSDLPWIAIDAAMPEHPGVLWRKRYLPKARPVLQVNSMLSAVEAIEAGLGIGVVALFHARRHPALQALTPPLDACQIDLWLLTHPESRHLRRIAAVARHLEQAIALD